MTVIRNVLVAMCLGVVTASAQTMFWPARYRAGGVPQIPTTAIGGGEVIAQLDVDANGAVTAVKTVRTTPPFGALLVSTLRKWQFTPAEELAPPEPGRGDAPSSRVAAPSRAIVIALFRPPTILNTPTVGEQPHDVAPAADDVPMPIATTIPAYPPTARDGGSVVLEAAIDAHGVVDKVTVLRSTPPFDAPARAAVTQWRFRAARWRGRPVPAVAYVVIGFRVPVG